MTRAKIVAGIMSVVFAVLFIVFMDLVLDSTRVQDAVYKDTFWNGAVIVAGACFLMYGLLTWGFQFFYLVITGRLIKFVDEEEAK